MNVSNEKGYSAISAIVAMMLFSIIALGLNVCIFNASTSNTVSKDISKATSIAHELLENLKTTPYNTIVGDGRAIGSKYYRSYTVQSDSSKKIINVTVAWPLNQAKHTVNFATIISKP